MAEVSIVEFKATVNKLLQDYNKDFLALKAQIDAELESYRKDPTKDLRAMIRSQNERIMALGVNAATALGDAFDETGLTKKSAPQLYAATENIADQLNAKAVEYLQELNKTTQALPKMISKPRTTYPMK